jgi:hypothetical protein
MRLSSADAALGTGILIAVEADEVLREHEPRAGRDRFQFHGRKGNREALVVE